MIRERQLSKMGLGGLGGVLRAIKIARFLKGCTASILIISFTTDHDYIYITILHA